MTKLSIIIKALNEERFIAGAIESALAAAAPFDGEVVLADSGSTDRTVAIARPYPIRIVQLARPAEASCGAGPQLGYQHSSGQYVYIMDGDMRLEPAFLREAVMLLDRVQDVAGVGGLVEDRQLDCLEYQRRAVRKDPHMQPGEVDRLNGGGLYRRRAVEEAGYLGDQNLHSYEEFDLGARLRARGWRLVRLDRLAIHHYGHTINAYRLLWRRLRTGYAAGVGEVVRAAVGQPHLCEVLRGLTELRLWAAVVAWWLSLATIVLVNGPWLWKLALFLAVAVLPFAVMTLARRSIGHALYAVVGWNVWTLGLLIGLSRWRRRSPRSWITSRVLRERQPMTLRTVEAA